jgi:hypothetical protein
VEHYTYIHRRADDGKIFYVGKGKGRRAWSKNPRSDWWKRAAAKHGLVVQICARWDTAAEAYEHEKLLIDCFRSFQSPLVNTAEGGLGSMGHRFTEEQKANLSLVAKRRGVLRCFIEAGAAACRGQKQDPEVVARRSAKTRGQKRTPEQRAHMSERRKGIPRTKEAVEKTAAKLRGRKADPEAVAKRVDAIRGRKQTAQHIAKRVAAVKATKCAVRNSEQKQ